MCSISFLSGLAEECQHAPPAPAVRLVQLRNPLLKAPKFIKAQHGRCLEQDAVQTINLNVLYKPERTGLSCPHSPNDLWCAHCKGEFMLADRRYCYPLPITDFATRSRGTRAS
jgi:hypothetical protein